MNRVHCSHRYIDRFRYGQPLSREERLLMSSEFEQERVPLWWMSSSSLRPSFTPTKISHKGTTFWIKWSSSLNVKISPFCLFMPDPKDDQTQAISSPADRPLDDFHSSPCRGDYNMNAYVCSLGMSNNIAFSCHKTFIYDINRGFMASLILVVVVFIGHLRKMLSR